MRSDSRVLAAPVSTCTCQGWVLVPEGARDATFSRSSTTAWGTGSGRKARMERRVLRAASTAADWSGVGCTKGSMASVL